MAERDINTQELAELTGLSVNTISSLRSGRVKTPTIENAYLIAEVLGVEPNTIWPNR
ncbi:helix-turn-helix domain-containing protein [Alicyclobacillus fastidiosus]